MTIFNNKTNKTKYKIAISKLIIKNINEKINQIVIN